MNIKSFFVSDNNGDKSVTTTAFIIGFVVLCAKLILSGVKIYGITFSAFTGSEFGIGIAALGGIYTLRQNSKDQLSNTSKSNGKIQEDLPKPPRE